MATNDHDDDGSRARHLSPSSHLAALVAGTDGAAAPVLVDGGDNGPIKNNNHSLSTDDDFCGGGGGVKGPIRDELRQIECCLIGHGHSSYTTKELCCGFKIGNGNAEF